MQILIVASPDAPTNMFVGKLQDYIRVNSLRVEVTAVSVSLAKSELQYSDVVLVAPQVRGETSGLQQVAQLLNIPVGEIPTSMYEAMKGGEVLKLAQDLFKQAPTSSS